MDEFANAVWAADVNRFADSDIALNFGNYISNTNAETDVSTQPLFSSVNSALLQRDTYRTMIDLFDNYVTSLGQREYTTAAEQAEQDAL